MATPMSEAAFQNVSATSTMLPDIGAAAAWQAAQPFSAGDAWWNNFLKGLLRPLASLVLVGCGLVISYYHKVGLERDIMVAVVRAFVQLIGIGFVLKVIFDQGAAGLILLAIVFMIGVAGYTAGRRSKQIPGSVFVATVSIGLASAVTTTALVLLQVFPFQPRYIIPIAGMIVGQTMNVAGVTLKRLREDMRLQYQEIEAALALGANPRQATALQRRRALAIGMQPIIDSSKTIGLVSLPGAMTGMILGGSSPIEAVQLQLVVMYMQLFSATLTGLLASYLAQPRFFTAAYQIIPEAISAEMK